MRKIVIILICLISTISFSQDVNFFENANQFLTKHVKAGKVDYSSIKQNPANLDALIDYIANSEWTQEDEKAYLINVYNLCVIKKVVDNYPISSPMDVTAFFEKKDLILNGEKTSLDAIENKMLRPTYKDPRFHFSLVCGALGCPVLRSEAYFPDKLDAQLEEQTLLALNNRKFVWQDASYDATYISEIFIWYKEDFGGSNKKIFEYINGYIEDDFRSDFPIQTYDYDWTLNDQKIKVKEELPTKIIPGNGDDEFNLQTFTAGSLLGKGKFDFTLFNTLYTQNHDNWLGVNYSGYRSTFVTHLVQVTYGITKSKRINIGIDLNIKNSGYSTDSTFAGISEAFRYTNSPTSRFGLTAVGLRVKLQPFKNVKNFSIQSTLQMPTIRDPEGKYVGANDPGNLFWAEWDRIVWWNQFFFDKTWGKIQLFAEVDLLFRFKRYANQIGMLDLPMNLFLSYFPTKKITIYAMTQHVPRFTNNINPQDPGITDFVIPANYTASGLGFKYQVINGLNLELLYTNFWRGKNSGLGSTYNLGIKYVMN